MLYAIATNGSLLFTDNATNISADVFSLICREMVADEDPFEVPSLVLCLGKVCSAWYNLLGWDAFLWTHIDPSQSLLGGDGLDNMQRRLRNQFEVHKRHSRGVPLHLMCGEEDLPLLEPYLRELADRWASIIFACKSRQQSSQSEPSDSDAARRLSFPALREFTLEADDVTRGSNFDILECGPAVQRLQAHLVGDAKADGAPMRLVLPVSTVLTSLFLNVVGSVELHSRFYHGALERCSATLETLEIWTTTTVGGVELIALPRLRKLYVHGKACSLLEVLEMRSLVTLWVHEFVEEDKGLERLSDAFRFDRIGQSTLRHLQLSEAHAHESLTLEDRVLSVIVGASNVENLALAYTDHEDYVATCLWFLLVLSRTREGVQMPNLRRLTLALGVSDSEDEVVSGLDLFLRMRDRANLHVITDIYGFPDEHLCTYTQLEDRGDEGCFLGET